MQKEDAGGGRETRNQFWSGLIVHAQALLRKGTPTPMQIIDFVHAAWW